MRSLLPRFSLIIVQFRGFLIIWKASIKSYLIRWCSSLNSSMVDEKISICSHIFIRNTCLHLLNVGQYRQSKIPVPLLQFKHIRVKPPGAKIWNIGLFGFYLKCFRFSKCLTIVYKKKIVFRKFLYKNLFRVYICSFIFWVIYSYAYGHHDYSLGFRKSPANKQCGCFSANAIISSLSFDFMFRKKMFVFISVS